MITQVFSACERQTLVLALSYLTQARPGWHDHVRGLVDTLDGRCRYAEFVKHRVLDPIAPLDPLVTRGEADVVSNAEEPV